MTPRFNHPMRTDELDVVSILSALGRPAPLAATPVRGGADAQIWRVEERTGTYALRVLRPEQATVAAREIAVLRTAAAVIPVPRIEAVGIWRGHPALLLAWCDGRLLIDELRAKPWRAVSLGIAFGDVHASIHRLPPPPEVLAHPVPWQQWGNPDPALVRWLTRVESQPPALLHLDYHPLNLLVTGSSVSGVLDWANTRAGDPRADIARTASILELAPSSIGLAGKVERVVRRAFALGWQRGYRRRTGGLAGMAPFYAWAGHVMEHDLAPRLGRDDLPWLTPAHLDRIRRWTAAWDQRWQRDDSA